MSQAEHDPRTHDDKAPGGPDTEDWLAGGGEMSALVRATDWSRTPLGPIESWNLSLKTAVSICLNSRFPIVLWWGPELRLIYNNAWRPALGEKKHPALGKRGKEVWEEIWHIIGPMLESVLQTGHATWAVDMLLPMDRYGYLEETYWTYSYSPIHDDRGNVEAVFTAVQETTAQYIGERRLRTLRDLGAATATAKTTDQACRNAMSIFTRNAADLPFSLIYLQEDSGHRVRLAEAGGVTPGDHASPLSIELNEAMGNEPWPLLQAKQSNTAVVVNDVVDRFGALPKGAWPYSPTQAVVLPLRATGQDVLAGYVVAGVNPGRRLDDEYMDFLTLAAEHTATAIANARAYEEERRRAEMLVELDRAKTTFFSNVSHEFRTPLTLMLGPVEDLLSKSHTDLSPAVKDQLELVNRNGVRLLRLVNTLLDFSRIEAGRVQACYIATDLATFTAELASVFRAATERAGLDLIVDCRPLSESVYIDRDMWEKIVLNLLSNAFKFTFEGSITVSVRQAGHEAELRVADTGVGISMEELPRLFERFHRVEHVQSRTHEGSGIGLALVQELVRLHSGRVRVESVLGQGSTFIVTLPLGAAHLPASRISHDRPLASTATGAAPFVEEALRWLPDIDHDEKTIAAITRHETLPVPCPASDQDPQRPIVLIVDDNADMRQYIERLLSERYCTETAGDGEAALQAIEDRRPDLIISDVMMPKVDGFAFLRALRGNPGTKTIPVILLSARAGEESRVEGLEHGADDYLIKPFSARELLARVDTHVKLAEIRRTTESEIARSKLFLERIATATPDMLFVQNVRDGRNVYINRSVESVLGYSIEQLQSMEGDLTDVLVHPDDRAAVRTWHARFDAVPDGTILESEHRIKHADQSYRWILARASVFEKTPEGGTKEIIGIAIDITQRKQIELTLKKSEENLRSLTTQLEQQVEQRTEQLVQSQTRLRALATELNLAEHRERTKLAAELHDHLAQMLVLGRLKLGQCRKLMRLNLSCADVIKETDEVLNQALAYTRTLVAELSPPVLHEFGLRAALRWLAGQMERYQLMVAVDIQGRTEWPLAEDRAVLLFQSIRELLINISKHARTDRAIVRLRAEGDILRIEVQDEGRGFSLPVSVPGASESTKFGLFSIGERMKALGGQFHIESAPGRGTTATLLLPLERQQPLIPDATQETAQVPGTQPPVASIPAAVPNKARTIRVLLVDDHVMLRQGLRTIVTGYDHLDVVGEAGDGLDAIRLAGTLKPDVIVMDINMPKLDGIEATKRIRDGHRDIAIIGLSVHQSADIAQKMSEAGAVAYLTKESAADDLCKAIESAAEAVRQ